jgi:hypothetical protein
LRGFGRRPAAVDYAFFKLNVPEHELALLVDFIIQRPAHLAHVRVSVHAAQGSGVYWDSLPLSAVVLRPKDQKTSGTQLGACWLNTEGSRGTVGPVTWDVAFLAAGRALVPLSPAFETLRMFDLFLRSVPDVRLSGQVTVAGHTYPVDQACGMVSSYHGRELAEQWYWVSCNTFDRADVALECLVARSAVYGWPDVHVRSGYLYVHAGEQTQTIVAPLNGSIALTGTREAFTITARARGSRTTYAVQCQAEPTAYHDLGDRIWNTLVGSCSLEGVAIATGTAGLEQREPRP